MKNTIKNLHYTKEYLKEIELIKKLIDTILSFKYLTGIDTRQKIIELLNDYKSEIEPEKKGQYRSSIISQIINKHKTNGSAHLSNSLFKLCLLALCRRIEELMVNKFSEKELHAFSKLVDELQSYQDRKWKKAA